jgi:tRNA uridine 5-carboxymethylaminomethyl modification enzyme
MGRELGIVSEERWSRFFEKRNQIDRLSGEIKDNFIQPGDAGVEALLGQPLTREYSLHDLAKRPEVKVAELLSAAGRKELPDYVTEQVDIDCKYQGYIVRQLDEIDRIKAQQDYPLPGDLDYTEIHGLSNEVVQKLNQVKPATLGQAGRISGVTPAAVSILLIHLKKQGKTQVRQSA